MRQGIYTLPIIHATTLRHVGIYTHVAFCHCPLLECLWTKAHRYIYLRASVYFRRRGWIARRLHEGIYTLREEY